MASSWPTTRCAQLVLHVEQLLALALEHLVDGNAGPARDHLGDLLGGDLLLQDAWPLGLAASCQLLLQLGDDAE